MPILGLDVSKSGVAVVEIESAFGRYEIRSTREMSFSEAAVLKGKTVTSLPAELTTFRNMSVASKDKKSIRAALEFELEDDLPFEKENLLYDSVILNTGSAGSQLHIGAMKKENFVGYLSTLTAQGLNPDVITTDTWAYRSLFSRVKGLADCVLLFGLDETKAFFYVHAAGKPILYREIAFGTDFIGHQLKAKFGASDAEIQSWIRNIGVSGLDEQVSQMITEALEVLVPELKQTELAARAQHKGNIEQIYVTGSAALMPGFLTWLEDASAKPVALFKPLSMVSPVQVSYSETTEIQFAKALALALTLMPADKLPALNFRKGEFSKESNDANSPLELIKKPLPYVLATLAVFSIVKVVEFQYYSAKLKDTDEALKRSVKTYFPTISDSAVRSYTNNPNNLRKMIDKDLTKERELAKLYTPNTNSPLDLLKNLSQKIGKDIVTDLVAFDSGSDNADKFVDNRPLKTSLTFLIANPQLLVRLTDVLEKSFPFKKGNSEEITIAGHKTYRVTFTGTVGGAK